MLKKAKQIVIRDYTAGANKSLDENQENSIRQMKKSLDKEASQTAKFIKTSKYKLILKFLNSSYEVITRQFKLGTANATILTLMVISVLLTLPVTVQLMQSNSNVETLTNASNAGSIINVSMNNESNTLEYYVKRITVATESNYINVNSLYWLGGNLNTKTETYTIDNNEHDVSKELALSAFDISDKNCYMQYKNSENTGSKELWFASSKPASFNDAGLKKINNRVFEKSTLLETKIYANSFDKTFLMLDESLAGGKLDTDTLRYSLGSIEEHMTGLDKTMGESNIVIEFKDMKQLDLSKISEVKDAPQVIYDRETDVLRVRNYNEDIDYIYISSAGNEIIGCNAEDLIATNIENLFIHKDYDSQGKVGYKTFAMIGGDNLYVIKLNSLAHESLLNGVFEQLGIDNTQIEVKKVQRVVPLDNN